VLVLAHVFAAVDVWDTAAAPTRSAAVFGILLFRRTCSFWQDATPSVSMFAFIVLFRLLSRTRDSFSISRDLASSPRKFIRDVVIGPWAVRLSPLSVSLSRIFLGQA